MAKLSSFQHSTATSSTTTPHSNNFTLPSSSTSTSLSSAFSQLIEHEISLSGGDQDVPDLIRLAVLHNSANRCAPINPQVHKDIHDKVLVDVDDEAHRLDSARSSFSVALKECQERRTRSEAIAKNSEHRRPASVDVNTSVANAGMKKNTVSSSRKSSNFPSPGTPNKGWSSERVALQASANRRHQLGTILHSFNNGRNLPSKWEDAERWIFSPVAGEGNGRHSRLHQQKRPKSKSGPLGAPGVAYYAQYSPGISMYDESNVNSLLAAAGVLMPTNNNVLVRGGGNKASFLSKGEPCVARSASVHGCSNMICQSPEPSSQDEKVDDAKDDAANVYHAVSRRDAATQMSPPGSSRSSSRRRSSFSASTPSIFPIREVLSYNSAKPEVRDVLVDERVTVTRWSKKHKSRISGKGSEDVEDWKLKAVGARSSTWAEAPESLSTAQGDEAKITAWENLQKAKAEAALRKLEMKLEKKRSRAIDKIMSKLRSAEKKAQEMRRSAVANQENQESKTFFKATPLRRTRHMGLLSGCFTCKAS